ncbi:MAG: aminotransferase class I/II-fold pyridoxal phosphate-dependent enzyme [Deltaproteobacteria bacterium]|nr:aminotransferase class I/II-fold pyridoxal phosphate-dependent enzyme [Deltaproteobacteria bacterium]
MRWSRRLPVDLSPSPLSETLADLQGTVDLTESNPTKVGLGPADLDSCLAPAGAALYRPEALGLDTARSAVAAYAARHGLTIPADRLALTASTSEAYAVLFKLLCDPGDRIAVPAPSYPLFDVLAELENVELTRYQLTYSGRWHLDLDSVAAALDAGARAVVAVLPNNPTGSTFTAAEAQALKELCARRDVPLVADEVFRPYACGETPLASLGADPIGLTFVLDGLSKALALPQLKLGWIAVAGPDAPARQALQRLEWIADAYLSVATPVQLALPALFERAAAVQARVRERVAANRDHLAALVATVPAAEVLEADGGWYAVLRLPASVPEEDLVVELARTAKVLVHPGFYYDFTSETHLVLALIQPPDLFAAAGARMRAVLARHFG